MFTQGKWFVDTKNIDTSGWIDIRYCNALGLPIASLPPHFSETQQADARLIAASKDLYQTVLDLLPLAEHLYGIKSDKVAAIQAIIDQVRGAK
jgi:hypothetical protein